MNAKTKISDIPIEQGSGHPYTDLGRPDARDMLIKAELTRQIGQIIKDRHITQQQAATVLDMTQPKLSGMLRGRFHGISQTKVIKCLNRLGHDVSIVVKKAERRSLRQICVVMA